MTSDGSRSGRGTRRPLVRLGSLLEETRTKAALNSGQLIDRETWRRILGDRIAQHSVPQSCRGKTLTVAVGSSVWAQELSLLMPDIIRRLQGAGFGVSDLRWQVQPLPTNKPATVRATRHLPLAQLPNEVELALGKVKDLELRHAIQEAAAHVIARQQRTANARPRDAQALQSAEPRTSPPDPNGTERRAGWQRTRARQSG